MEDMPFVNARISGALIDFEDNVDYTTSFSHWNKNRARGVVGELPIAENHTISMLWETGQSDIVEHSAKYCDYHNNSCYYAKTVPVILELDESEGYYTGGQNLTVKGHGFKDGNIVATVDGVDCEVTRYNEDGFSCDIQAKGEVSSSGEPTLGSPGIRWRYINGNNLDASNLDQYDATSEQILTQFEVPYKYSNTFGHHLKGWFIPPASTYYRFYMSCDDYC
jgi:hypothetical protein